MSGTLSLLQRKSFSELFRLTIELIVAHAYDKYHANTTIQSDFFNKIIFTSFMTGSDEIYIIQDYSKTQHLFWCRIYGLQHYGYKITYNGSVVFNEYHDNQTLKSGDQSFCNIQHSQQYLEQSGIDTSASNRSLYNDRSLVKHTERDYYYRKSNTMENDTIILSLIEDCTESSLVILPDTKAGESASMMKHNQTNNRYKKVNF